MAGRRRRSKKRSDASSRSRTQPDVPQLRFFIDECLGTKRVAEALTAAGSVVVTLEQRFDRGVDDRAWLSALSAEPHLVVLTKDSNIRRRPLELRALLAANLRCFVLVSANLTGPEQADVFVKALPAIRRICAKQKPPFVARVTRSADVEVIDVDRYL
jgi:hypothetical protein